MISFSLAWVLVTISKNQRVDVTPYLHDFLGTGACDALILITFLFFLFTN